MNHQSKPSETEKFYYTIKSKIEKQEDKKNANSRVLNNINKKMIKFQQQFENEGDYHICCVKLLGACSHVNNKIFDIVIKNMDINSREHEHPHRTILMEFIDYYSDSIKKDWFEMNQVILSMLDRVNDINMMDDYGDNVLHSYLRIHDMGIFEINDNSKKIIIKILELGVDIFAKNQEDFSAIEYSFTCNNVDLTNLILTNAKINGVSVKSIDISVLFKALECDVNYDIVELLLQYIDDINACDNNVDIKDIANSKEINPDIIELLKTHGARI